MSANSAEGVNRAEAFRELLRDFMADYPKEDAAARALGMEESSSLRRWTKQEKLPLLETVMELPWPPKWRLAFARLFAGPGIVCELRPADGSGDVLLKKRRALFRALRLSIENAEERIFCIYESERCSLDDLRGMRADLDRILEAADALRNKTLVMPAKFRP